MMYKLIEEFKDYNSYGKVLKTAVSFGIDGICKEMIEGTPKNKQIPHVAQILGQHRHKFVPRSFSKQR
jgi:hypothetical protein